MGLVTHVFQDDTALQAGSLIIDSCYCKTVHCFMGFQGCRQPARRRCLFDTEKHVHRLFDWCIVIVVHKCRRACGSWQTPSRPGRRWRHTAPSAPACTPGALPDAALQWCLRVFVRVTAISHSCFTIQISMPQLQWLCTLLLRVWRLPGVTAAACLPFPSLGSFSVCSATSDLLLSACREHTVAEGLQEVAVWNSAQMVSQDLEEAFSALQQRRQPQYSKL